MTTSGEQLALRLPGWVRALGGAVVAGWLYAFLSNPPAGRYLLPGVVLTVLVTAFLLRVSVCSVVATADGRLTVRNIWSTRTFARPEVEVVGIDRADGWLSRGRGWVVYVVLADGSRHRLDVTETFSLGPSLARLEHQAAAVRAWAEGRPQPWQPTPRDTR